MSVLADALFCAWICIVAGTILFILFHRRLQDRFDISTNVSYMIILAGLVSSGILTVIYHEMML